MDERDEEWLGHRFGSEIAQDAANLQRSTPRTVPNCPTYDPPMYLFLLRCTSVYSHKVIRSSDLEGEIFVQSLVRGPDGRFSDDDLADILLSSTEIRAGAPGACSIPAVMRNLNTTVMERARRWEVCTLNQFRLYLGLKRMFDMSCLICF